MAMPELRALPQRERAALRGALEKLAALGEELGYPHTSAVQGAGETLRELRPRQGDSPVRAFYLASNPYPPPPHGRKLTDGGGYRLRVGDYRVIYEVDSTARRVVVTWVGPRRDAYRRR